MPLNTIGYMVILLILVIVILMMTSRSTCGLFSIVDEKISDPADQNECLIKCYSCCRYDDGANYPGYCGTSDDDKFDTDGCDCDC